MEYRFNVSKEERKALVKAIADLLGAVPAYLGAPGFKYAVGACVVDRDGAVVFGEGVSAEDIRTLLAGLAERGFVVDGRIDMTASDEHADTEPCEELTGGDSGKLSVDMPFAGFTATALGNLEKLITAKAWIIRKMAGADELPILRDEEVLRFPWFSADSSPDKIEAYTHLVAKLCDTAKQKQRVTASEHQLEDGDNEKFKARCFLLSLGFIGKEYAPARKILLAPMSGSGSFRTGSQKQSSASNGITAADSGEESTVAVRICEEETSADTALTSGAAAALLRCGGCSHHCYYTTGDLVAGDGNIVDTSRRSPDSYTHYCLKVPSGYRKIKHATDWSGSETAPKWCPLYTVNDEEEVADNE
jgi:hypothetical protein